MGRIGQVIEIQGDIAFVAMRANAQCGDCNACSMGQNDDTQTIEALNEVNAHVGDLVEFDMEIPSLLSAAFIAYTIPLITMVGSIALSHYGLKALGIESNRDFYSAMTGFLVLFITLKVIRKFDSRMKESRKFMAKISRIEELSNQEVCVNVKR
ncbi:MAG: hypothetical protein AVO33_02505 [delta proteobacterium ML8_F1]|nr:MAG: hypothetical protein AVO33_02505 [delta proteobacterium ML8_F1]